MFNEHSNNQKRGPSHQCIGEALGSDPEAIFKDNPLVLDDAVHFARCLTAQLRETYPGMNVLRDFKTEEGAANILVERISGILIPAFYI
jgi:hypothetical protein